MQPIRAKQSWNVTSVSILTQKKLKQTTSKKLKLVKHNAENEHKHCFCNVTPNKGLILKISNIQYENNL